MNGRAHAEPVRPNDPAAEHVVEAPAITRDELLGIIRTLPDVVFRCEKRADGKIYWTFNEGRLAEEFHLTTREIEGKSLDDLFPGGASDTMKDHFEAAFRGEAREFVNEMGGRFFKHYPQPVYDGEHNVIAVVGFITDVTNLQRAQQQVQHLSSELAARLIQIHETNNELQAFNYTLSHDLRAPLTIIEAQCRLIDLALGGNEARPIPERTEKIRDAARRMLDLMENVLALSNASRGELHREPADLSAMAAEVLGELATRDPARVVDIEVATGVGASCDRKFVRQLLDNLLGNAWKYTAQKPTARVTFGETWHDGERIFYVRDNGVGFDMKQAGRLFEPFQRLSTAGSFKGSGVGLATCRKIVERHGGRIWAEGRTGEGATVYFTLGRPADVPDAPGAGPR